MAFFPIRKKVAFTFLSFSPVSYTHLVPKSSFNHVFLQSNLYIRQDKVLEASQLLERELLGSAGNIQSTLLLMLDIALKEQDMEAASYIAKVSEQTAYLYDLWTYNSYVAGFQLAVSEKDESKTLEFLQKLLEASQASWDISASCLLYTSNRTVPGRIHIPFPVS